MQTRLNLAYEYPDAIITEYGGPYLRHKPHDPLIPQQLVCLAVDLHTATDCAI